MARWPPRCAAPCRWPRPRSASAPVLDGTRNGRGPGFAGTPALRSLGRSTYPHFAIGPCGGTRVALDEHIRARFREAAARIGGETRRAETARRHRRGGRGRRLARRRDPPPRAPLREADAGDLRRAVALAGGAALAPSEPALHARLRAAALHRLGGTARRSGLRRRPRAGRGPRPVRR